MALDGRATSELFGVEDFMMKEEGPIEDSAFNPGSLALGSSKEDAAFKFPDLFSNGDVEPNFESNAFSSDEFMTVVFEKEQSLATFPDLQLTDDVYIAANKQSTSMNQLYAEDAIIPAQNSETYRWRGDLGLLDRLAYGGSQIPRNWNMTSLSADRIASYQTPAHALASQSPDLLSNRPELDTTSEDNNDASAGRDLTMSTDSNYTFTEPQKKKRKKREKGNNPYGRKGLPKCLPCRNRGWKCVYGSQEELCQLCLKRGYKRCIKVSPSSTYRCFDRGRVNWSQLQREVSSLESIAPANPSADGFALSYIPQLIPRSSSSSLPQAECEKALQYSILAWKSRQWTSEEYAHKAPVYIGLAYSTLHNAICYGCIHYLGIFASHLLAWVAYSTSSEETAAPIHFRGSLLFLCCVIDQFRVKGKRLPDVVNMYGPFIVDCANAWATRHGQVPKRCTSFSQRVNYFDGLRRVDNSNSWHSGLIEAANSTLGNLMEVALTWVYNLATREVAFNFSRDNANEVLQFIRSELGDVDFYIGLKTIYK